MNCDQSAQKVGIAKSGGQFQIIIGNEVPKAYGAIQGKMKGSAVGEKEQKILPKKMKISERIFDFVSAIFTPVLPAIIGAGLVKSVLAVAVLLGADTESMTYYFLNFIGDAPLYFLPVMLAFTAAKKLGCNQFLAVSIAGAMLHPNYTALITDAYSIHFSSFLGIPVTLASYSSSVIPVLLMVFALKYMEAFLEKVLPKMVKFFFKPLLCLIIVAPVTFIVLGPIGFVVGVGISTALNMLNTYAGWLVPTIIGAVYPLMVTTGMHYGLVPFMMQSLAAEGFETIAGPGNLPSNIAQGAASLSVAIKTKKKELKQTAFTTGVTAVLGITEPALFGVTLNYKKVLACVMLGGGIGGFYAGIMGVKCFSFCSPGLLSLVAYIGPDGWLNLIHSCISMIIAFAVTFAAVWLWGYKEEDTDDSGTENVQEGKKASAEENVLPSEGIASPVNGKAVPLSEVPDPTFAEEMLGKGAAVDPSEGRFYAPVSGTISTVFPTKHAIGITGDKGEEILIHVGLDTVQLDGKYFETAVSEGQHVEAGTLLLTCELEKVREAGYKIITPVIVTNPEDYPAVSLARSGEIKAGERLISLR
ncbi:MAG TPA: beta-glucoside-specific PTS transporter subunit IIABC [Candidatus Blautia merdipullorum]|nr:beta-glucoside-specific PTS transporter subunit IIABC [Candidatus Blautia merdipullorum]